MRLTYQGSEKYDPLKSAILTRNDKDIGNCVDHHFIAEKLAKILDDIQPGSAVLAAGDILYAHVIYNSDTHTWDDVKAAYKLAKQ